MRSTFVLALAVMSLTAGCAPAHEARLIEFTTPGGRNVVALYRLPRFAGFVPAVLYHHGRMVTGHDVKRSAELGYNIEEFVDRLAAEGYATLAPLRTGDESAGDLIDINEGAVLFLKKDLRVDPKRIGLMGFSLGGRPAMLGAQESDAFRCLVLLSPKMPEGLLTKRRLERVRMPVVLFYGTHDIEEVKRRSEELFIPAMTELGLPMEIHNRYKALHRWFLKVRKEYWTDLSRFLELNLKPQG
jgi:dienelactone hydrolase